MVDLDACNAAASRIREAVPIVDRSDAEIVQRWQLTAEALSDLCVPPAGTNAWRYTLHADGGEHGVWSNSDEEAAISCAMWWHSDVVAVSFAPFSGPIVAAVALW